MDSVSLEKAKLYERYRLPYAREAVDGLLDRTGSVEVVADIGAGTGQLAQFFAGRCKRIYAVEPDSSMRHVAQEVLKRYPEVTIVDGSAEQTTLATESIDLIVIGNAFHRFRAEACEELHRILRKSGWVALFSYAHANKSFTDMLFSKLSTLESLVAKTKVKWHRTSSEHLFGSCPTYSLNYPQSATESWESFFGAACSGIEAPERTEADFVRFEAINREVFEAFAVADKFKIEYETIVQFGQPKA